MNEYRRSAVPANSFVPGNVRRDAHFHSFHSPLHQKLENRIDFVLANLVVQPCPLLSDECFSSNEFAGTAEYQTYSQILAGNSMAINDLHTCQYDVAQLTPLLGNREFRVSVLYKTQQFAGKIISMQKLYLIMLQYCSHIAITTKVRESNVYELQKCFCLGQFHLKIAQYVSGTVKRTLVWVLQKSNHSSN